jgi:hypothetical protein
VTSIGQDAFAGCEDLTSVTIPDSVTSIDSGAFSLCYSLTSVTIPNGVTTIEHDTFTYCFSLTSIIIPDSVTSIGYQAFYTCYSLTSITIPSSVTSIEDEAFNFCESLESVYYSGSEDDWKLIEFGDSNEYLLNADIYYNSTGPATTDTNQTNTVTVDPATGKTMTDITVEVSAATYTGKAQKPSVVVKDANGNVIKSSEYTIVGYQNNTNAATADDAKAPSVTVKSKGNYIFTNANANGEFTQTFTIEKAEVTLSNMKAITTTYTGSDVTQDKKIIAKIKGTAKSGKKTVNGTWSFVDTGIVNAKDEPYTVTVKFTPTDKSYAEATTTIQLTVNPAKISVKKVALADKKATEVKVGDEAEVTGVTFNGLVGADKNSFDGYDIVPGTYTKAKKGSQKISYTITLTDSNYTFGGKGDGTTKTGTASAKITAG